MADRDQLVAALKKADQLYKETGDEKHKAAATRFARAIRGMSSATPAERPETEEERIDRRREEVAEGITLRPFGMDTGIELPQGAVEFLAGAGRRLSEIGTLGAHEADPRAAELLDDSGYATAGGIAADVAALAPVGLPATAGRAALTGAAYAGATTPGDVKERAATAAAGGLGGLAGHGLTKAASRVLSPKLDPRALELEARGVRVTPGRLIGGTATRVEDMTVSAPLMGDAVKRRQADALADYNRAVLDDVLAPLRQSGDEAGTAVARVIDSADAPTVTSVGREGVDQVSKAVSRAYDKVLDQIDAVELDDVFQGQAQQLRAMAGGLEAADERAFQRAYDGLMRRFDNPTSTALGFTYKQAESSLRKAYQKAYGSGKKQLGDALRQLFRVTRDTARRQHPELVGELDRVDEAYAKLKTVQAAANYGGAREGVFTPSHLLAAIKKKTPDSLYARGKGFDQKAVESAKEVLSQSVPDSGTAGRGLLAAMSTGLVDPLFPLVLAGGAAAASRPGNAVVRKALLSRPKASRELGDVLDILAPYLGKVGTAAGINQP